MQISRNMLEAEGFSPSLFQDKQRKPLSKQKPSLKLKMPFHTEIAYKS